MKANVHYSSVKPINKVSPTKETILFFVCYLSFALMVLGAAFGMDLLKLWLK